jgi:hypothetical protein
VLVLDADERLAPGAGKFIHEAIKKQKFVLGLLPLYDASRLDATPEEILSGAARRGEPILLPRLLRKLPDLSWKGRVHENIADWITTNGRRATHVNAPILHFGAVPELRVQRGKAERNLRILELQCAEQPEEAFAWSYLAAERERAGDNAGSEQAEEQGWEMLKRAIHRGEHPATVPLAGRRALRRSGRKDWQGALAVVAEARSLGSDHPNLCWLAGTAQYWLGEDAVPELERALTWTQPVSDEVFEGVVGWRTQQVLAAALLSARPADALRHAEAVLAKTGEARHMLLCVDALLELGRVQAALERIEPLLPKNLPDAWALAAIAAHQLGEQALARTFAARVQGPLELHRTARFAKLRAALATPS